MKGIRFSKFCYIKKWIDAGLIKNVDAVKAYQDEAARKSDFERTDAAFI